MPNRGECVIRNDRARSRFFRAGSFLRQTRWRTASVDQMANPHDRMMAQHARPSPAHDRPHLFAPIGAVTMHQTLVAGRLGIAERATLQPSPGIREQGSALGGQSVCRYETRRRPLACSSRKSIPGKLDDQDTDHEQKSPAHESAAATQGHVRAEEGANEIGDGHDERRQG